MNLNEIQDKIFDIQNEKSFEECALQVFKLQYNSNLVYKQYCDLINIKANEVTSLVEIPFLPT